MANDFDAGPVETGANMDYSEHEKTFGMFYALTKWGTVSVVVILILMALFLL